MELGGAKSQLTCTLNRDTFPVRLKMSCLIYALFITKNTMFFF